MTNRAVGSDALLWQVVSVMGLCLVVAGAADLGLGLFPLRFGVPEWEFGSVSNLLNRLPLLGLGVTFTLVASLAQRSVGATYLWASILLLVAVIVFVLGLVYATNLPIMLGSVTDGAARPLLKKAMVKAIGQVGIFFLGFLLIASYGVRAAGRLGTRARRPVIEH